MSLIQKIKELKLQAIANQSKKLDDNTEYHWADEQSILDVLDPALAEHGAHIEFSIDMDSHDNMIVMELFLSGHSIMKRSVLIGETRNNNEFTARCTTIRRDMMSMLFGIRSIASNVSQDPIKDVSSNIRKVEPSYIFTEAYNAALIKVQNTNTNDGLMILKDAIEKSKKLNANEKMQLFEDIANKIENGNIIQ